MAVEKQYSDFSVVILCYNHERFIKECLESILNQDTDEPFDIVIADDASTDGSVKVIEATIKGHPWESRITFIKNEKNLGLTDNCWNAIQQCKGKYLIGCGGDDVSRHDRVRELIALQKKYPEARAFKSQYTIMDSEGQYHELPDEGEDMFYPYNPRHRYGELKIIWGCVAMWHKESICAHGPFPSARAEDVIFSYRTHLERGGRASSYKRLVYYRTHGENICNFGELSLEKKLKKHAKFETASTGQMMRDLVHSYTRPESTYTKEEFEFCLRQLFHHIRDVSLYPYAQYGRSFTTKWRWFISASSCQPINTLKYAVRLLPRFAVRLYLKYVKK